MNDDRPHYEAELRADPELENLAELEAFLGHVDGVDLWRCRMKHREMQCVIFCDRNRFEGLWFWTPFDEDEPSNIRFLPMLPEDHPSHTVANAYIQLLK